MNITTIALSALIPYEFNARRHDETQVDRIANSIKEFGFNQPIVVDESNIILVGHGRLEAARKLGLDTVPVVKLDKLTETQKKAYRILDNKLQNDSTWDFQNLELDLGFLEDNGLELEPWGLDKLRALFEQEPEAKEDDFDASECENEECFIKRGDRVELGRHVVLCGDALIDQQDLMSGIEVRLVFTDPPYGIGGYDGRAARHDPVRGDDEDDFIKFYKCIPNAPERYIWADYQAIPQLGELPRDIIIWAKNNFGLGRGYRGQYEMCLYYGEFSGSDSDLWHVSKDSNYLHPTQKPVELPARAIKNSSKVGDVVLDLFLGSGTTLIACEQLNRTCYGMEIEPKYCHVIIERYRKYCADNNKAFQCKINGSVYP